MGKPTPLKNKGILKTILDTCNPPRWSARQKNRLKSILAWLAKGAEHACPT